MKYWIFKAPYKNIFLISVTIYMIYAIKVLFIEPSGDDWDGPSLPLFNFSADQLLPHEIAHWRPLWTLWGYFLTIFPTHFIYVNHITIISLHFVNSILLLNILEIFKIKRFLSIIISIIFLFSTGSVAAVASIDGFTVLVVSLNLLGLFSYLKYTGWKKYFFWLFTTTISLGWLENGIVWFVLPPFLSLILGYKSINLLLQRNNLIPFIKDLAIGISFVLLYFIVRLYLSPHGSLSQDTGRYMIHFNPVNILKNISLLTAISILPIDTISIFSQPKNYLLGLTTAILSIPIALLIIYSMNQKLRFKNELIVLVMIAIAIIVSMSPRLIIERVGEMHAYPSLPLFGLFFALLLDKIEIRKSLIYVILISFSLATVYVDAKKINEMYKSGKRSVSYGLFYKDNMESYPNSILFIRSVYKDLPFTTYSVFRQTPFLSGSYMGNIIEYVYNYEYSDKKIEYTVIDLLEPEPHAIDSIINKNLYQFDYILTFDSYGNTAVFK